MSLSFEEGKRVGEASPNLQNWIDLRGRSENVRSGDVIMVKICHKSLDQYSARYCTVRVLFFLSLGINQLVACGKPPDEPFDFCSNCRPQIPAIR